MTFAYIRVSTRDQNPARQVVAIHEYRPDLDDSCIFVDKKSGKDFEREQYLSMKARLTAGDEVIVKELDRLGRNKDEIKAELQSMKELGVTVRILNVPTTLIDFGGQAWVADMVNNILIEVMGAVAEEERNKILSRQREGIDAMPVENGKRISRKTGRPTGRPAASVPDFPALLAKQRAGECTVTEACAQLGISRSCWYGLVRGANG